MKQTIKLHLTSTCPLLMHNGRLADPLDNYAKEIKKISGKRNKTEADHEEIGRLEWFGSLYLDGGKPCIPGFCMDATLINGAKKTKKGMLAKSGLISEGNFLLDYDGPTTPEELWEDERFRRRVLMRVSGSGIMRTQPHFPVWSTTIVVSFSDESLNASDIEAFAKAGGDVVGVLEGRPRLGRFTVKRM